MSKQSHHTSKKTVEYLPTIKKFADEYGVQIRDLLGPTKAAVVVAARVALAKELRSQNLTYKVIGEVINRDHTSVRHLLRRKAGIPQKPAPRRDWEIATRGETERMFNDMCKRGSAALLLAIFATGKSYRPMDLAEQLKATEWAKKAKPLRLVGWMR